MSLTKKPPVPSRGTPGHRQGLKSRRFLTSQSSGCHSPTCQRAEVMRPESWALWAVLPSNTQFTASQRPPLPSCSDRHQLGCGAAMVKRVKPATSPVVQHWIRYTSFALLWKTRCRPWETLEGWGEARELSLSIVGHSSSVVSLSFELFHFKVKVE